MTTEGLVYWLRVQGSRHPALYLGETKASRYKYTLHVQKPQNCLVYKGGPKLDKFIEETNVKYAAEFKEKQAAFEAKFPPGTIPSEISPTLWQYEAVEVVAYKKKDKIAYKVKK